MNDNEKHMITSSFRLFGKNTIYIAQILSPEPLARVSINHDAFGTADAFTRSSAATTCDVIFFHWIDSSPDSFAPHLFSRLQYVRISLFLTLFFFIRSASQRDNHI